MMGFRLPVSLALPLLLSACGACGDNDDAIALAEGLTQERLALLVRDIEALPHNARFDVHSGIPEPFKDLQPLSIRTDRLHASIHLSGCVDDKVVLFLRRRSASGGWEVVLAPGERREFVTLWPAEER